MPVSGVWASRPEAQWYPPCSAAGLGRQCENARAAIAEKLQCRRCGRAVSAAQYETFERMHYVCFHYEFEHDPADTDQKCRAGGMPFWRAGRRPGDRGGYCQAALGASPREPGLGERVPAYLPRSARSLGSRIAPALTPGSTGRHPRMPARSSPTHCAQRPYTNEATPIDSEASRVALPDANFGIVLRRPGPGAQPHARLAIPNVPIARW